MTEDEKGIVAAFRRFACTEECYLPGGATDEELLEILRGSRAHIANASQFVLETMRQLSAQAKTSWTMLEYLRDWNQQQ